MHFESKQQRRQKASVQLVHEWLVTSLMGFCLNKDLARVSEHMPGSAFVVAFVR
jgi:hypothetical protein